MRVFIAIALGLAAFAAHAQEAETDIFNNDRINLIIRADDMGFCHTANVAFEQAMNEGLITSVSLMVVTPWFEEAVEILAEHPEVSVGLHLALNSEWTNYKWGPVSPVSEVPSLVDEWGHFYGMRVEFNEANPNLEEIDKELRAQVDLALSRGVNLSYIDHHMGTAGETQERRAILQGIANDYGLGISRWFGEEQVVDFYFASPEAKAETALDQIAAIDEPGLYLAVFHPGLEYPEMLCLQDVHTWAPAPMATHRAAELSLMCSDELRDLIAEKNINLINYNEIQAHHLDRLKNPDWEIAAPPDED